MRWSILLVAALSTSAFAEQKLYKCVVNGRVTYTDFAPSNCETVNRGSPAPLRKQQKVVIDGTAYDEGTAREIARYRQGKAEEARSQIDPPPVVVQQPHKQPVDTRQFEGKGRAGRNMARVLSGQDQIEDTPPAVITNCNAGGCYDSTGRYLSGNPGGTMNSPDGKVCRKSGTVLNCN